MQCTPTELDTILDALANEKRRAMLDELALYPSTVSKLARQHELSLPAIHKHIRILEQANLIHRKKVGRTNFIALNASSLALVQNWIMQYNTAWNSNQATLENYIASMKE